MSVNLNTAIFLVNAQCRALTLAYEWCDREGKTEKGDPFATDVFKTLDPSIKKGDLVLGETQSRHKLCVYKVIEADVEIDLARTKYIPWVVGRVKTNLEELQASEAEMISAIRQRDKEKQRAELAETMMKDYGGVIAGLKIAGGGQAIAPPPQMKPIDDN